MGLDIKKIFDEVIDVTKEKLPTILIGVGIASSVASTALAIKNTPIAITKIKEKEKILNRSLTLPEKISETWINYLPSGIALIGGITCTVMAHKLDLSKIATATSAAILAEKRLTKYSNESEKLKKAIEKTVGKEKEDEIVKEANSFTSTSSKLIPSTGHGDEIIKDFETGQVRTCSRDYIIKTANNISRQMLSENWISANEFYQSIGFDDCNFGSEFGFDITEGFIDPIFEPSSIVFNDCDRRLCWVMKFKNVPHHKYTRGYY